MARRLRPQLDLLHPDYATAEHVHSQQEWQKGAHDGHAKHRCFQVGDVSWVVLPQKQVMPGKFVIQTGLLFFWMELGDGLVVHCYIDHMIL